VLAEQLQPALRAVVWVRLGTRSRDGEAVDLDAFAERVLPTVDRPLVLLTTDGDATVPTELRPETVAKLLASPWLRAWYTQNCDVARPSGHQAVSDWAVAAQPAAVGQSAQVGR
jgi:hypothetical protein